MARFTCVVGLFILALSGRPAALAAHLVIEGGEPGWLLGELLPGESREVRGAAHLHIVSGAPWSLRLEAALHPHTGDAPVEVRAALASEGDQGPWLLIPPGGLVALADQPSTSAEGHTLAVDLQLTPTWEAKPGEAYRLSLKATPSTSGVIQTSYVAPLSLAAGSTAPVSIWFHVPDPLPEEGVPINLAILRDDDVEVARLDAVAGSAGWQRLEWVPDAPLEPGSYRYRISGPAGAHLAGGLFVVKEPSDSQGQLLAAAANRAGAGSPKGDRPSLGLKATLEESPVGGGVRASFVLINPEPLSAIDTAVRLCLPQGWAWGPASLLWKEVPGDLSTCRRFLLGAVPGEKERRFTVDLVKWPPLDWEGGSPFAHVLDVAVFAASRSGGPAEMILSRSYELHPSDWPHLSDPPSDGMSAALALDAKPGGGRAGARWSIADAGAWGSVEASLEAGGAWEAPAFDAPASAPSLAWTAGEGTGRIGSPTSAVEFAWRWGPVKEVAFEGLEPTLPVTAAWRVGGQVSGAPSIGDGLASARLGVGRAEGDIWSCRLADAALGWEGNGLELELGAAEVVNALLTTKGIQERRAALLEFETGSRMRLAGRPWSIRSALIRGVPRTLTPSCGLSPKEGWRLRLQAENPEPDLLERLTWTAAWPLEPREERPFTHELAAAVSAPLARDVRVDAEPALRFTSGGAQGLALRTQAFVGPLHRVRLELGPERVALASELPRAGEGSGRVALGWDVRRGAIRPRLAYETETDAKGRAETLRGGLTVLGSASTPWSGGSRRVEWSVRVTRELAWGPSGERFENLLALRLGRRPSTLRAEWTWTNSKQSMSLTAEHAAKSPQSLVARSWLSVEQKVEQAGRVQHWEGAVEGRWTGGHWGAAIAHAGGIAGRAFATWELGRWQLRGEWIESLHPQEAVDFLRWVEFGVKRAIGETLSLVVKSGHRFSAGSGPGDAAAPGVSAVLADAGRAQAEWRPTAGIEWHPAMLGSEALVAMEVGLVAEKGAWSQRIALSLGAPLAW